MKVMTKTWCCMLAVVMLLALLAMPGSSAAQEKKVVVGGKNFTEQYILPELAKDLLEKNGFTVDLKTGVGSVVARQSLENGQIDLYYEYTGTAYTVYYKQDDRAVMTDPQKVYQWVRDEDAKKGLVWLQPVKFNNTYTLMMRKQQADELGIKSISDLSKHLNEDPDKLVIGVNAEFWERPDGFKPLMKYYDFRVPYDKIKKMDSGLVYKALKDKNVDVSMGFATDGRIAAFDFVTLQDDKSYFPDYSPAPVVRKEILDKYPDIAAVLQPIAENLTTEQMQLLNAAVDVDHKDVSAVAKEWLEGQGFLQ
ncbi:glycine betaine ABC transporter substrate-binding protein [Desulfoferrobacter suflitae]|uniref:ABC transporter substrate-binding protein n=1 Tax=Desulfoferrobacter suflitae TaxID=2865782 RepID=UPI002164B14A|nr:glycine betaine ABC transporter substrate-binding protein [Desulfoferrobacter suflitae]MCK8604327.1 glycine betaine ABC transporter substrate-binding protein [Desulfoferrobacter suflitae]